MLLEVLRLSAERRETQALRTKRFAWIREVCARATYDFPGTNARELSFKAGDEIVGIDKVDQEWWEGELDGQRGVFPANRVEPIV